MFVFMMTCVGLIVSLCDRCRRVVTVCCSCTEFRVGVGVNILFLGLESSARCSVYVYRCVVLFENDIESARLVLLLIVL